MKRMWRSLLILLLATAITKAIDISNCSTLTQAGATYNLTANISIANMSLASNSTFKCIDIQANNITLDCQGHQIDMNYNGSVSTIGISVTRGSPTVTNVTIKNCIIVGSADRKSVV
jgi:hypothetical protein